MSMQDAVNDAVESGELELGDRKITTTIPGPDGQPEEIELWEPTLEQIAWLGNLSRGNASVQNQIAALSDLMDDLMEPELVQELWKRMRNRHDPLKIEHVSDAISMALEAIQDFPTQPSSGSSGSSTTRSSGKRSTGRVRGPGSTSSS